MGKKGAKNSKSNCGFTISDPKSLLKSNSQVNLTKKVWIENNLDRPFDGGGDCPAAGDPGPTGSNSGGANEVVVVVDHTIHRDEYVSSSSSCLHAQYSSAGEMVPLFTNAQWTELERQAMIYKYMVSSLSVPLHLLHSIYAGGLVETVRCKRTDGKKWRCSRDVAPHQKYCERHLHRGRPRSRKPVEINNNQSNGHYNNHKKARLQKKHKQLFTSAANDDDRPLSQFIAKTNLSASNRDLGLMMENEMSSMNGAFMELSNMGFLNDEGSSATFHQDYMDRRVLSYSNYLEAPIGLIDAWSVCNNTNNLNSITNQKVNIESADQENFNPWLNLSIAMTGGGNVLVDEMGVGEGASFYDEDARYISPVRWEQFGPGGPLGEALMRNPASPHSLVCGPTATAVSSPSGVTQRTVVFKL